MQRHKDPLDFAESPYEGSRHNCISPVYAAERPVLLPSTTSTEMLNAQWLSPQFQNLTENSLNPEPRKRRRAACGRKKLQKNNKETVEIDENNLFPSLIFSKESDKMSAHRKDKVEINDSILVQKEIRTTLLKENYKKKVMKQQQLDNKKMKEILFSNYNRSPMLAPVSEILVPETPECEMGERMIDKIKRLRDMNRDCKVSNTINYSS